MIGRVLGYVSRQPAGQATGNVVVRGSRLWPLAAVTVAGMVMLPVGYVVYKVTRGAEAALAAPGKVLDGAAQAVAEAVRPKVNVTNVIMSAITSMQAKSKLVVLDTTVDLDVTREEAYTTLGVVYLGTNRVRLIARENRVQYAIDLAGVSKADFAYDEAGKTLTVTVPRPILDEAMASVQSDPAKCYPLEYAGGWMRFDKADTLAKARAALRPALLEQARAGYVVREADRAGLLAVRGIVEPLTGALAREGVRVEVRYRGETGTERQAGPVAPSPVRGSRSDFSPVS